MQSPSTHALLVVATFYRFAPVASPARLRARLLHRAHGRNLRGTILVAAEGVNGTISGPAEHVRGLIAGLREEPGFADLAAREAVHGAHPFGRFKVRVKREIVSLGVPGVDPNRGTGRKVAPDAWHALIERPDVQLVDVRNRYEVHLGTFAGAVDPGIESFREFPAWAAANLDPRRDVAMFCTGGIRCEKAAAQLLADGFEQVHQLDGGILAYLAAVPPAASRWRGECFVFDERVTVDHRLTALGRELCPNCRIPILPGERDRPEFEANVTCRHCHDRTTARRRAALAERHRQQALVAARFRSGDR